MNDLFVHNPLKNIGGIHSFIDSNETASGKVNETTRKIREFYETNPFPNYDEFDSLGTFYEKAKMGIYAKLLDEQLPTNVKILEAGCGTGQLSNFLANYQRQVIGCDMSLNSLILANNFKIKQQIRNVEFVHADIFNLPFKENSFDFVISKGVLHHTYNCHQAFNQIAKLVKPGGFIILGLYNSYGRFPTWLRKQFYMLFPDRIDKIDYILKNFAKSDGKKRAWILDQYANPHETWHSVDEVLGWFDQLGFTFINAIPKISFSNTFAEGERLFLKSPRGNSFEHFIIQLLWIFTISREGALFDIIGRKKKNEY